MDARALTVLTVATACCVVGCREFDLQLPGFREEHEVRRENVDAAIRGEDGHSRLLGDYIQSVADTEGIICAYVGEVLVG